MSLRPEEVEKESGTENGSNGDTDENIIRRYPDEVIVIYGGILVLSLDKGLL